MTGFNSNFNDIQKQISFANLTDEQIKELMSLLQTKRICILGGMDYKSV